MAGRAELHGLAGDERGLDGRGQSGPIDLDGGSRGRGRAAGLSPERRRRCRGGDSHREGRDEAEDGERKDED